VPGRGKGKSGGYRVLTYYMTEDEPVYLISVINKDKVANRNAANWRRLNLSQRIFVMSDEGMDKEDFDGLIEGLKSVAAYERGEREGFVTHVPATVDVRAIRAQRGQTQDVFARTYGFSVASIRDWEQGRRQPERSARILLAMIAQAPDAVERVIRQI
jgi:putative transcriptional regulator